MDETTFKQIAKIICCPITRTALYLDEKKQKLLTIDNSVEYSIIDDVIHFALEESRENIDDYAKRAKRYEKIFEKPSFSVRLFDKFVWGITHIDYAPHVIDFIPENFNGILLDIPVGTGIFTSEKYKNLPDATIIVADYSNNMLKFAKQRYTANNMTNVIYFHADVGNLLFLNQSIEMVISMNGFHAFPDKDKALKEIARVSKTE